MHLEEKSLHAKPEACFPLDHRTEVCGCSVYPVRPLQGSLVTDPDPGWAALSPERYIPKRTPKTEPTKSTLYSASHGDWGFHPIDQDRSEHKSFG